MEFNKKIDTSKASSPGSRNKKILDELIQLNYGSHFQKINPDYLNTFIYHDHISKNIMNVSRDSTFGSSLSKNSSMVRLSHVDSSGIMKESFNLLKSTRKFHLNSIQNKNYKLVKSKQKANQKQGLIGHSNDYSMIERKLLEKYVKNKQENQLKYKQQKRTLTKMLQLSNIRSTNLEESEKKDRLTAPVFTNIKSSNNRQQNEKSPQSKKKTKIISTFEGKKLSKHLKYPSYFGSKGKENSLMIFYDETEKEVLKEADHQFKYLVRKNAEFLVTPDINKRVIIKNKNNQNSAAPNQKQEQSPKNKDEDYFSTQEIMQYRFKSSQQQPTTTTGSNEENLEKNNQKQKIQQKLIREIETGSYFRVQIELSVNPSLLHTKDKKNNNNLLHISVMSNREDIFEMVAKKCREHQIDLIYEKNKYGRNPIQLGKILSFFKKKQVLQLLAKVEKEQTKRKYDLLTKIIPNER